MTFSQSDPLKTDLNYLDRRSNVQKNCASWKWCQYYKFRYNLIGGKSRDSSIRRLSLAIFYAIILTRLDGA